MKYRITFSKRCERTSRAKSLRLRGRNTLSRRRSAKQDHLVEFAELFDFGMLYEPYSEPPPNTFLGRISYDLKVLKVLFISFARRAASSARAIAKKGSEISERIKEKRARKPKLPSLTPTVCGALCAAVTVASISFGVVVYKLIIEDYFGSYETVTVPDLIGGTYPLSVELIDSDTFSIDANYVYSDLPEGTVISQRPAPDLKRRIYGGREPCAITLTVSLGKRTHTMNDLTSLPLRDALLELRNESIRVNIDRVYSDTVAVGKVISTSPEAGNIFSADQPVTLTVSLGKKAVFMTVPSLFGLTESRAISALRAVGLPIGEISYIASTLPCGTVVSQSHDAYSAVAEGVAISFTVSAGERYHERVVPDLYGLTVDEARAALADAGLVCGNIYAVANGASGGTVISQSPLPNTPIGAGIVSVDIYVSSQ